MTDSTANGGGGVKDGSKVEKIQDQDTGSIDEADIGLEKWLKPDTPSEITQRVGLIQRASVSYSGPLPPASEVAKYEEAYPGAAERIFALSENLLKLQDKALHKHHTRSILKTITSTLVSLSMIAVAGLAILYDPAWLSIPLGSIGFLSLLLREWFRRTKGQKQNTPNLSVD